MTDDPEFTTFISYLLTAFLAMFWIFQAILRNFNEIGRYFGNFVPARFSLSDSFSAFCGWYFAGFLIETVQFYLFVRIFFKFSFDFEAGAIYSENIYGIGGILLTGLLIAAVRGFVRGVFREETTRSSDRS